MKFGKLTKLSNNENALRSSEIEGNFLDLPENSYSFEIINDNPLETSLGQTNRRVITSIVKEVLFKDGVYYFKTLNSEYMLEVYEKVH
jgi:hypothetical protein